MHRNRFYHSAARAVCDNSHGRQLVFSCLTYNDGRVAGDHRKTPQNEMNPATHPSTRLPASL